VETIRQEYYQFFIAVLIRNGKLENAKIADDFFFPNDAERELHRIDNCHFEGQIIFNELSFDKELIISNCQFDKSVVINTCEFPAGIKFVNCIFSEELFSRTLFLNL
jgi:hypothetical protein